MNRPFVVLAGFLVLSTLAFLGCSPANRIDAEIAMDLSRGDYEGARQAALRYLPADPDLWRGSARLVYINQVESRAYLHEVTVAGTCTWRRERDEVRVNGEVRNGDFKPIRYFEVTVQLLDRTGEVVDTAVAVYAEDVQPHAVHAFEILHIFPGNFQSVRAEVTDVRVM